jgi:hypothetical protein
MPWQNIDCILMLIASVQVVISQPGNSEKIATKSSLSNYINRWAKALSILLRRLCLKTIVAARVPYLKIKHI